jgi:hypothetical protein
MMMTTTTTTSNSNQMKTGSITRAKTDGNDKENQYNQDGKRKKTTTKMKTKSATTKEPTQ